MASDKKKRQNRGEKDYSSGQDSNRSKGGEESNTSGSIIEETWEDARAWGTDVYEDMTGPEQGRGKRGNGKGK